VLGLTAAEQIYHILKDKIISLALEPGQALDILKLSTELGVSRSPVRDALLKLQEDNLVEIFPQRGTQVSRIDLDQVELERFLRTTLETAIIPKFCAVFSRTDQLRMESAINEQKLGLETQDSALLMAADEKFHQIIYTSTAMERLWKIYLTQCGNYQRIRRISFQINKITKLVIKEHQDILDAFIKKDEKLAVSLESEHLNKLKIELTTLMNEHPQYFKEPQIKTF